MGTSSNYKPPSCHYSHKVLSLGGGEILGASCWYPRDGFDVYVGLDRAAFVTSPDPWEGKAGPVQFEFFIPDGTAPKNVARFKKMILWLTDQLHAGKRVHVGCIGGHGRTGLLLSALVAHITGNKDAITWVRTHHCKKAVESSVQVDFLMEHYGCNRVQGSKHHHHGSGQGHLFSTSVPADEDEFWSKYGSGKAKPKLKVVTSTAVQPFKGSNKSVWAR